MDEITKFTDLARQQILKEQLEKRVTDLDDWLAQCDIVWKEQRVLLPYPKYPNYPSDDEVIARAKLLYDFDQETNKKKEEDEKIKTESMVEQPQEEAEVIKINTENEEKNLQNNEEVKIESNEKKIPALFKFKKN